MVTTSGQRRTRSPHPVGAVVLALLFVAALWTAMGWVISVIAANARDGVSVFEGITIAIVIYVLAHPFNGRRDV